MASKPRPGLSVDSSAAQFVIPKTDHGSIVETCYGWNAKAMACGRVLSKQTAQQRAAFIRNCDSMALHDFDAEIFLCRYHKNQAKAVVRQYAEMLASVNESLESLGSTLNGPNFRNDSRAKVINEDNDLQTDDDSVHKEDRTSRPVALNAHSARHRDFRNEDIATDRSRLGLRPAADNKLNHFTRRRAHRSSHNATASVRGFAELWRVFWNGLKHSPSTPSRRDRRANGSRSKRERHGDRAVEASFTLGSDLFAVPTSGHVISVRAASASAMLQPLSKSQRERNHQGDESRRRMVRGHEIDMRKSSHPKSAQKICRIAQHGARSDNCKTLGHSSPKPLTNLGNSVPIDLPVRLKHDHSAYTMPLNQRPNLFEGPSEESMDGLHKLEKAMERHWKYEQCEGFIYVYWREHEHATQTEKDLARSIGSHVSHSPATLGRKDWQHRQYFRTPTLTTASASMHRPIAFKIGMAKNVQQRVSQWKQQCGYDVPLLRQYPESEDPAAAQAKIVHVKWVERLIHLHLEKLGVAVKRRCRCGIEHKEWFEIPGDKQSVRELHEIINYWIVWVEQRMQTLSASKTTRRNDR